MNAGELEQQLHSEGFGQTYLREDGPDACSPDHAHLTATAHIILEGEMTVPSQGKTQTYRVGERLDVPARTVHSARMGPTGCRYLIGEK